jgi:hypothetical protein
VQHVPLVLLVLLGVALRLWLIGVSPLDPRFSNADDGDYYQRALRLAVAGQYVDDAWLIRPPLHVWFFAAWLRLALALGVPQHGVLFVQLAQTVLAALTVLVGYALAHRLFARHAAGLLFAGFLALWYPFVEGATVLFTELIYLFLFLLHLWLLARFDATERRSDLLLSGIALGAAALTRSPALYASIFTIGWLVLRRFSRNNATLNVERSVFRHQMVSFHEQRPTPNNLTPNAQPTNTQTRNAQRPHAQRATRNVVPLFLAAVLAIVAPWTMRNYLTYERFIPVDTLGQVNLWLDLDRVADRTANIETLRALPQADRHLYALARAREILAEDPWRPFRPMWSTFRHVWKAQFVEDYYVKQSFFTRPLRESAPLGLAGDLIWLAAMVGGIWGLAGPVREGWHNRLFYLGWVGYSLLTVLIFHVEPRYLLPIWTLFALYGAGALAQLHTASMAGPHPSRKSRRGFFWGLRPLAPALVLAFFALLLTYRDYPAIIATGTARERAMASGERSYAAGEYAAAELAFREALAAQPQFVDAQVSLALALAAQGRNDEAAAILRRNASRRTELVVGALARDAGDETTARQLLTRIEAIAGEDTQRWALTWLRPPAATRVALGSGLDLGYIAGFSPAEQSDAGPFRWLEGTGLVTLPLPTPLATGDTVALRLTAGRDATVPLVVRVAGGPAWEVPVVGGAWRTYHVPVPPEAAGQTSVTVELRAPTFVPARMIPGSSDARALSLMVSEVRVR